VSVAELTDWRQRKHSLAPNRARQESRLCDRSSATNGCARTGRDERTLRKDGEAAPECHQAEGGDINAVDRD
jgi:hypothetical protein